MKTVKRSIFRVHFAPFFSDKNVGIKIFNKKNYKSCITINSLNNLGNNKRGVKE